ncbi:Fc receptor-like protein 5, partial [Silurus meridionalis]
KAVVFMKPDAHVFIGETMTLTCGLHCGGYAHWPFGWYKNNERLHDEQGYFITAQTFSILSVNNSHSGSYTCNDKSSMFSDAELLTVSPKPKPIVRVNPQTSIYTGDTVTLSCELKETSKWDFLWYNNSQPMNTLSRNTNVLSMTMYNVGETKYQCQASRYNPLGVKVFNTESSDEVTITARERPQTVLSVSPQNWLTEGDSVTLSCEVTDSSTDWTFSWYTVVPYRDRLTQIKNINGHIMYVELLSNSSRGSGGNYTLSPSALHHIGIYVCRGERGEPVIYTLYSNPQPLWISERPQAVLSVSPQNWLTEGDSVTLSCEVTDSSTDWTFSWYTVVPYRDGVTQIKNTHGFIMYVELLSDSSRGSGGSYTLSPSALHHTGVYVCRGERGEPAIYTHYSNTQPLWISDESPPVSLIISPSRTQHFTHESLSLSCEDQSNSTGWTVRRYTDSKRMLDCSWWGSVTGSTCSISFLSTSYTGVYWCESESGENSNPVNITVHDGDVILESSVHPVTEGHPLTLRCLYHNTNPSNLRADFYKDGSVVQNQTTGEMIIHKVSKSDEGFYHCKHPERGASLNSWISVR